MYGKIEVEADNWDDAEMLAEAESLPLGDYVEGSFELCHDEIADMRREEEENIRKAEEKAEAERKKKVKEATLDPKRLEDIPMPTTLPEKNPPYEGSIFEAKGIYLGDRYGQVLFKAEFEKPGISVHAYNVDGNAYHGFEIFKDPTLCKLSVHCKRPLDIVVEPLLNRYRFEFQDFDAKHTHTFPRNPTRHGTTVTNQESALQFIADMKQLFADFPEGKLHEK